MILGVHNVLMKLIAGIIAYEKVVHVNSELHDLFTVYPIMRKQ